MNSDRQYLASLAMQTFVMTELITFDVPARAMDLTRWLAVLPPKLRPEAIAIAKEVQGGRFINRRMDDITRREFISAFQDVLIFRRFGERDGE